MAKFQIRGLDSLGRLQSSRVTAGTSLDAEQAARLAGLSVLAVTPAGFRGPSLRARHGLDLALFAQELIALLGAGLSLIETLETLLERQQEPAARDATLIDELVRRMQEGQAFSKALAAFPETFPALFVASIAASEHTGEIVPALRRWLRYHQQLGAIRQKMVSASIYPALLCVVGMAVALFLLCFLVPRFSHVYEGMENRLPLASRWLMRGGAMASEHWAAGTAASMLLMVSAVSLARRPAVRRWLGAVLERNRWIGYRVGLMQLSRFYRAVGMLLDGGLPVTRALEMARGLLPLSRQPAASAALIDVMQGRSLSESLRMAALTTPVALRLLRAGERNGQVARMLEQAATFHDHEMAHWIDRFTRLFEPMLMLAIGLAIGGLVVLLYLPIFELAGTLQ
jgi:general secretion pathway protein F